MVIRRIISLILPIAFLWAWSACVVLCAEVAEHSRENNHTATSHISGENECSNSNHCSENCVVNTPVNVQEKQFSIPPHTLIAQKPTVSRPHNSEVFSSKIITTDINQNSPPNFPVPIFLRLHNFRI